MRQVADIAAKAKSILHQVWDPIGVSDIAEAASEYDAYAPVLARLLTEGADEITIRDHLVHLTEHDLGLTPDPARCSAAAKLLIQASAR